MGRAEAANVDGDAGRQGSNLKLGKYQLLAVLGRGGMAEVFLALSRGNLGFDKLAVVKRLRPGLADDDAFRTMFLDEARLAARLNHPNVVHTYEVGEHEGVYFIAMEYLEGQALNKITHAAEKRGEPLEPRISARIISDALAGLHHAHTLADFDGRPLGIIHRDISPHNLFVTYEGTTKLVDFGIAKAALSSTETEVGVLKGKVAYMSPEQATGVPLDARSDVFAMGIVLWEMLTQRRLMTGDSAASTIHRLLTAPVPPVSSMRRDVSQSLDAIVDRALKKNPDERFSSALEMREAIEEYLASTGNAVRSDEVGHRVASMFTDVREAIKRQIQEHVEGAGAPSGESSDSKVASPEPRRAREGTMVSAELPLLNVGGGSGSGVVSRSPVSIVEPSHAAPMPPSSAMAPPASAVPTPSGGVSKTGLIVGFVVLLVAAVAASIGTQVFMRAPPPAPASDFTAGGPAAQPAPTAATPTAPATPTALPTVPPLPTAVATAATPATPAATPKPGPHTHHATAPAPAAAAPAADTLGWVTFDTYPWTRVTEGSTSLGTTPLVHVALPAGSHTLTLDNPDQGIHQTYSLTVKAGESMTKRLGLK